MSEDINRSIRIYLNTTDANKKYSELVASTSRLTAKLNELQQAGQSNTHEFAKVQKQIDSNVRQQGLYEAKVKETTRVLKNLSGATLNELNAQYRVLKRELANTTRGTTEYTTRLEQLRRVETQRNIVLKETSGAMTKQESGFSRLASRINKYGTTIMAAAAAVTGISLTLRKSAQDAAHMDDVYSDVMKTTGLTKEEVLDLNVALKAMDTRTSRENLNLLARDAGKLGISGKEDLLNFVEGANQIKVALGEDLGEDAIKNIGKMADVYSKATDAMDGKNLKEKMLAVGSAINELGANSSASEPYLVQFAARLGGVANQAGIGMDSILGYASALDQDMQAVEMSATAFQKFIMVLLAEPDKMARQAGLNVKEFNKLLGTDTNAAIKQVLTAMNEKGGLQQLIPTFKELGLDGARAVGVLSSMASSIGKVEIAQGIATKSMQEATSVTKEYNIKNNNMQAALEKAKKSFLDASEALGKSLSPILLKSTKATTYLIKAFAELGPWLKENKGLIITLVSVWSLYALALAKSTIATKANLVISKAVAAWKTTEKVAVLAASYAYNTLTGNTVRAAAAQKMLKATMASTPWGAILVAVTALAIGVYKLATAKQKVTQSAQSLINIQKEVSSQYGKQAGEVDVLVAKIKNENIRQSERLEAIKKLKEIIPGYNGMLNAEGKLINHNTEEIKNYLVQLEKQIKMKAAQDEWEELIRKKRLSDKKVADEKARNDQQQERNKAGDVYGGESAIAGEVARATARNISQDKYNEALNEQKEIQEAILVLEQEIKTADTPKETIETPKVGGTTTDTTNNPEFDKAKDEKNAFEKLLNEKERLYDEYNRRLKLELNANFITTEDYNVKIAQSDVDLYAEKAQLLEKFKPQFAENIEWIAQLSSKNADSQIAADEALQQKKIELLKKNRDNTISEKEKELDLLRDKAKDDYAHGRMNEAEYNQELSRLTLQSLTDKIIAHQTYQNDIKEQIQEGTKVQVDALEEAEKATADSLGVVMQMTQDSLIDKRKLLAQFQSVTLKDQMAEEIRIVKAKLGASEAFEIAKKAIEEKYANERYQMAASIGLTSLSDQYANEMAALEKHLAEMGATEEESEQARANVKLKYAQQYNEQASQLVNAASAFTQALQSSETANLDAEHEKRLSALTKSYNAGIISQEDYNNQKSQLDYEQKVDSLEIEKKYADANFAMQAATITIAMATGIMSAWASSMSLGPIAGPIAGGILTALLVGTGIAQLAQANAEREKIKAMTIEAPASSSSGSVSRVALPQAKEGRYNVIGADDGKAYDNVEYVGPAKTGIIHTPTLVGEAGSELIVDHKTLNKIRMDAPFVLEAIQQARVPQRASGNYTKISDIPSSGGDNNVQNILSEIQSSLGRLNLILGSIDENGVESIIVLTELERKIALRNKSKNRGTKQ